MNNFSNYGGSSYGTASQFQNQGNQRQYQPVGFVQSTYGQNQQNQQNQQQFGSYQPVNSFHTANYRGDQMGHDAGLRSDSWNTAQQGGAGYNNTDYSSFQYGIRGQGNANAGVNNVSSQFGFNQSPYSSAQNQNQNQYQNQNQFQGANTTFSSNQSQFGGQGSYPSVDSYHTANYRGNQMGHDAQKRSDSSSPTQQTNFSASNTGNSSFNYGLSGNQASNMNNATSQFGFSQSPYSAGRGF